MPTQIEGSDPSTSSEQAERPPQSFRERHAATGRVGRRKKSGWKAVLKWSKRTIVVAFLLGVVAMIVMASLPKPVPVELAEVQRGALEVTVDEDGRARVKDRYVVSAPLGGTLARIELRAGDSVQQGDVLARLVPLASPLLDDRSRSTAEARVSASGAARKQAKAQIDRAKAALAFAKSEVDRLKGLADRGSIARQALERALLEKRTREAELTSSRFGARIAAYEQQMASAALGHLKGKGKKQDQLVVPSPVTGRVLRVMQRSEGAVQAGTPLLELGDPKALELVVDVLTSDAVNIGPGAKVHVERWGGERLEGMVRLVEPSAFTRLSSLGVEEQRVNAIIDLRTPYEKWSELGDGYRVEARIIVWQADQVLKVPSSAVFRQDDGWAVFVDQEGLASLKKEEIGRRSGLEVQIISGLEPGDRVVTHPSDRVTDGVKIVSH